MSRIDINLVDSHFAHEDYCVPGVGSETITWRRSLRRDGAPTVITHEDMYRFPYADLPKAERLGLLLESQSVVPRVYSRVTRVIADYRLVFTHSEELLKRFDNTRWIPGGGVWIGGSYAGGTVGVHDKSRLASMLTSNKLRTPLHRRRYLWAVRLEREAAAVDVFRQKLGSDSTISAFETLRDYRYSIVVENFIDDRYFTEKVLNCFATGTVPIYLGARRLGDYFNPEGFIPFRGFSDLRRRVLPMLSESDYENRLPAIRENLVRALEYRSVEDYIFNHYLA